MRNKKGNVFIITGLLCIAAALILSGYNIWENKRAEAISGDVLGQMHSIQESIEAPAEDSSDVPDYILNPKMDMREEEIGGYKYIGTLKVPSCALELPIISEWTYPALKVSPCRFSGSVYTDDLILAGHNYNSHFKKIRELQIGEELIFTDMDMNEFRYAVVDKESISGSDIEILQGGEWDLSLFTCTASGRMRMVVRCERII